MPEGPEAFTLAESLNSRFAGKYLLSFNYSHDFKHFKFLDKITCPALLERVYSRGKKIIFEFENFYLLSTLGMQGLWYIGNHRSWTLFTSIWGSEHSEDFFQLEEILSYEDVRHFGWLEYYRTENELEKRLDIGMDLFKDPPTFEQWKEIIKGACKRRGRLPVCEFLLEQKYVSGIVNYLRAEILYSAAIHPKRTIISLKDDELKKLWRVSLDTISRACKARGASLRDYKDLFGNKGEFKVVIYGQKLDPEGNKIETFSDSKRRTVWFCPAVQIL